MSTEFKPFFRDLLKWEARRSNLKMMCCESACCLEIAEGYPKKRPWEASARLPPRPPVNMEIHLQDCRNSIDINQEYEKAFRTSSYAAVLHKLEEANEKPSTSLPAASPYHHLRVVADGIMDPRESQVQKALNEFKESSAHKEQVQLVSDYFENTAKTSQLCGELLKYIEMAKANYRCIKKVLDRTPEAKDFSDKERRLALAELAKFMSIQNPFSNPTTEIFESVQASFLSLLHCLELHKKRVAKKLKQKRRWRKATVVCILGVSVAVLVALALFLAHVFSCAAASLLPACFGKDAKLLSTARLIKEHSLLDAAAKGSYIMSRDLDTLSRQFSRMQEEIEHDKTIIQFCLDRRQDRHPLQEVVRQLRRNHPNFKQQLKEFQEHVYLCFVTNNRARKLLFREIQTSSATDSRQPALFTDAPNSPW